MNATLKVRRSRACVSRRHFLRTTAAVAGVPLLVPASALGLAGTVAPSNRLVMGCIGVGGQGTRGMAGGIWAPEGGFIGRPEIHIVAVCDVNRNNRNHARDIVNAKYGNQDCATYGDFRELLARPDIDIVLSATGERWHPLIGIAAVEAGKDIYSEKPVSVTIAEARALANTVKRTGRIFQIGTQQRSMANFRFACELVRNGYIGDLTLVTGDIDPGVPPVPDLPGEPVPDWLDYDTWLGPAPWRPYNSRVVGSWMAWYDYSGGDMTNWGAHVWDIVQWGLGMDDSGPVEIIPANGRDVKYLTYRYANGATVVRNHIPGVNKGILFEGTKGWVKVSREVFETEPASLKRQVIGPNEIHLHESDNHHTDFLRSVRTRVRNGSDAEVACRSITVCHLGNIADQLGRPLKWDPAKERFVDDPIADRYLARAMRSPWRL
jgi:predicted dehydrogenase